MRLFSLSIALLLSCGARSTLDVAPAERPSTCGNHSVENGETCDDGNDVESDACVGCNHASCGDGVTQVGVEACDDGNADDTDGCTGRCALSTCGNGIVEPPEECDDGNLDNTDACPERCLLASCGDGYVQGGLEECDLGPANEWRPALEALQGKLQVSAQPIVVNLPAVSFYGYSSASSHTGFEEIFTSKLYFYIEAPGGRLSLFIHHGIDIDSTGQEQPPSRVRMELLYLPEGTSIALPDDKLEELHKDTPESAVGDWTFHQNTDGGIVGDLPFPGDWAIDVVPDFAEGIDRWLFIDAVQVQGLELASVTTLRANSTPSPCRPTCTIPRCGDSVLDGGETCDDGNAVSGDGCSSGCRIE